MGVSKNFGTNITENHFGNLSTLFFGQALDQMGQKCRSDLIFVKKFTRPKFWAEFGRFWAQNPIFWGAGSKNLGNLVSGFQ